MKNQNRNKTKEAAIQRLIRKISKSYEKSLFELVGAIKGTSSIVGNKKVKAEPKDAHEPDKMSRYQVFLDVLKHVGRPVTTREIANRVKSIHPEIKISKNMLIKQMYNSASYLSKEGIITRVPVGKRMFEYSLKDAVAA